jgi:anti-sigma regulatory factor (Ser/Thr protein kinase)
MQMREETSVRVAHRSLPADSSAMAQAREYVRTRFREILPAARLGDAELMTSELVSNAVEHAQSEDRGNAVDIQINIRSEAVRVSIVDAGSGFDPVERQRERDIGGWGLLIVDRVSDRWGVEDDPHRVWFEIDR